MFEFEIHFAFVIISNFQWWGVLRHCWDSWKIFWKWKDVFLKFTFWKSEHVPFCFMNFKITTLKLCEAKYKANIQLNFRYLYREQNLLYCINRLYIIALNIFMTISVYYYSGTLSTSIWHCYCLRWTVGWTSPSIYGPKNCAFYSFADLGWN